MIFADREDAGRRLAARLNAYADRDDVIVLGIPRGGVAVAFEVAQALHAPLDIFLSRKLGVPGYEEIAFGAIAAGDGRFLDEQVINAAGISKGQIESITQQVRETLEQRAALYRGNRTPLQVAGRTVVLVDDGIATGASVYAAINALQHMKPGRLVVAVPVAPASTCSWLRREVDELICLNAPERFYAVGQFYESFTQVTDNEVTELLRRGKRSTAPAHSAVKSVGDGVQNEVFIDVGNVRLEGTLSLPSDPKGIVLFVHGSGSSRHSPRNRYVAKVLQSRGIATLLFDLLTLEEELIDRQTALWRFDVGLLTRRLIDVTNWVARQPAIPHVSIGYFGASTGAAAALEAAARLPALIAAVISRGGRPDLAGDALGVVRAPVLLIVGGEDKTVISLNRRALTKLKSRDKQLVIIPGATHLFEEPGALEEVASIAADWLVSHLAPGQSDKVSDDAVKVLGRR
jgi:putative phosphoribosyl transferase